MIEIELLVSSLLLIKSWSRYCVLATFLNGHTWFLSCLLFPYFLVPLLLKGINNIKHSFLLFLLVSLFRILIEEIVRKGAFNMYDADFHRGPFIRLLEFYMGMLMIPSFFSFKYFLDKYNYKRWFKIIFTFIQIFFPIFIYYIILIFENKLYRCHFVVIFCFFVFVSSYDYGFLSDLFANKLFIKIMSCQMEMYILQRTVNDRLKKIMNILKVQNAFNMHFLFIIKLFFIFMVGYLYKIKLKEIFAKYLDKIVLIKLNTK